MGRAVLKAIGETWYNLAQMLEDSARKLKVRPKPAAAIAVEMQEVDFETTAIPPVSATTRLNRRRTDSNATGHTDPSFP
ncbi:MAG: hypothetical protein L0Y72_06340 [Gemmataceae bacterium]|nr:hypothetical protein [Gemmataceae bacterium]MCI0738644.1 hypothetical protein [Gemmataceae bacterium]